MGGRFEWRLRLALKSNRQKWKPIALAFVNWQGERYVPMVGLHVHLLRSFVRDNPERSRLPNLSR